MKNVIIRVNHIYETYEIISADEALDEIIFNDNADSPVICSSVFDGFLKFETSDGDITYEVFRGNYACQTEDVKRRVDTLNECRYMDLSGQ